MNPDGSPTARTSPNTILTLQENYNGILTENMAESMELINQNTNQDIILESTMKPPRRSARIRQKNRNVETKN